MTTAPPASSDGHDDVVVRVRGLRTAFGKAVIHDNLDLDVRRGEIIGLVGGSGTGKSVLLETILGLKTPDAGKVEVLGYDIHDDVGRLAVVSRIGVMFQNGALFSSLTVRENVEAPLIEHTRFPADFICGLAELKIRLAGLLDDAGLKKPSELSGGMRKRAGVARAIALDPELLFLDEPTAGLDPIGAAEFDDLIRRLRDALGLTVLMVTHDLDSLYAICDRVAVLADRKVAAIDTVARLEKSDHPWIKSYFGGPRGRAVQEKID
ncbi:ABC transporter ATP-binding protein [Sphingomonas sp. Leaf242]|uniref:ABC transporter ATP-binding protein n=1 Tax=Sphingomonas sp. Leaf242 TaxID=1736304 RepID=UPI000715B57A|nr:ATP-binding cassette domain-containing protein [Sphingomonas sp. Leaf242]KQO12091.1 ABC transporter ATP-binding protein [Sphingomonas sp. Leaf242]